MLVTIDNAKGLAMRVSHCVMRQRRGEAANPSPPPSFLLQVGCFVTDHMRIHRVSLHEADKLPSLDKTFGGSDESPAYAGPNFEELDEALPSDPHVVYPRHTSLP